MIHKIEETGAAMDDDGCMGLVVGIAMQVFEQRQDESQSEGEDDSCGSS